MVVPEHALYGRKEIAEYLQWSIYLVDKHMPDFKRAGIIFRDLRGCIPHRKWVIYTLPSLLIQWLIDNKKIQYTIPRFSKHRSSNK